MTRRALFLTFAGALARSAATLEEQALFRKKGLLVHSPRPLDVETPPELLDTWITPIPRFFVRSHFYIPSIDTSKWRLSIEGLVEKPFQLTLAELSRLPQIERVVTMECAGNGRSFFRPPVAGIQWRKGAVGTARWKGVRLKDLLDRAALKPDAKHLACDGADTGMATAPDFTRSIPVAKALHPDTLLATHMNGVPLPIEHGFPVRLITPGWEGAASVKWLTKITAIPDEYDGFFMKTAYRYPTRPVQPGEAVDPKDMAALTSLTVKSLLTRWTGRVEGVAWAGEAAITKVEVSVDGGRIWNEAHLGRDQAPFAWRRFRLDHKPAGTVMSRATDSQGRTQPLVVAWNPSGYLHNLPDTAPAPADPLPAALPAGNGLALVKEKCLSCHDHTLITGQKLTPAGWTREVEKMMRWGVPASDAEKQSLIRYLVERFP
jgi:DMSO/TMAO reductase YedYZ molybdopterin-dependent catalytic subunit